MMEQVALPYDNSSRHQRQSHGRRGPSHCHLKANNQSPTVNQKILLCQANQSRCTCLTQHLSAVVSRTGLLRKRVQGRAGRAQGKTVVASAASTSSLQTTIRTLRRLDQSDQGLSQTDGWIAHQLELSTTDEGEVCELREGAPAPTGCTAQASHDLWAVCTVVVSLLGGQGQCQDEDGHTMPACLDACWVDRVRGEGVEHGIYYYQGRAGTASQQQLQL